MDATERSERARPPRVSFIYPVRRLVRAQTAADRQLEIRKSEPVMMDYSKNSLGFSSGLVLVRTGLTLVRPSEPRAAHNNLFASLPSGLGCENG